MRRAPRLLAAALALAVTAVGAAPVAGRSVSGLLPPSLERGIDGARADARRLSASLADGGILEATLAILEERGLGERGPEARGPGARAPTIPALSAEILPPGIRRPSAMLAAAVREASRLIGPLDTPMVAKGMRAVETHMRAAAEALLPTVEEPDPSRLPEPPTMPPAIRRAAERTAAAAAIVAHALDRALPDLAAHAGAVPSTGQGCDVHEDLPYLCIGSDADNLYTEPAALLIDLGGDDEHRHPAGGAPFTPTGQEQAIPVSVTVDLEGDDRYVAEPIPGTSIYPAGQGFAVLGGVGILVDAAGNDRYESTAPATSEEAPDASSLAQGIGLAAGYGALFDLGGSDAYSSTAGDGEDDNVFVFGQGVGYLFEGAGAVVDRGGGRDSYLLDGGTVSGLVREWDSFSPRHTRQLQGQGQGFTGTGILADDGGVDSIRAIAHARSRGYEFLLDPAWEPPPVPPNALLPIAAIWAQGNGIFGGSGYLLTGGGPTAYEVFGSGDQTAQASLLVQGYGFLAGVGTLADAGGPDWYSAKARVSGDVLLEVADGCACGAARARFEPFVSGVSAQGWGGSAGGEGVLLDSGGDDRYEILNLQRIELWVEDWRASPPATPETDLRAWPPPTMGQGWATVDALGALVDESGSDAYGLHSILDARAGAVAPAASEAGSTDVLVLPRLFALGGQGGARTADVSGAALLDLAGSGDRFTAVARTQARAFPDETRAKTVGFLWPPFQGSGDTGVFAALGEDPVVISEPSQGVCAASTGPRGYGTWSECPLQGDPDRQVFDVPAQFATQAPEARHWTAGLAPRATGLAPDLSFEDVLPSPPSPDPSLEVSAVLLDPSGAPMPGEEVRFDLQFALTGGPEGVEPAWFNGWEVTATTDEDGVARGVLPADLEELRVIVDPNFPGIENWVLRVLASFDGAPGLHPRHVAWPLG